MPITSIQARGEQPMDAGAASPATGKREKPWWRDRLAPYSQPDMRRSVMDLATSVVPYVLLFVAMYLALDVSVLLTLALAVPAAGFLVRSYIVFHDCTHGSFMPSKRANAWVGRIIGLLVYSPFEAWKHEHWMHHASAGDLERRGDGDVETLTVDEYYARGWAGRAAYRVFRNPLVMFTLGPIFALVIGPRLISRGMRPRIRHSVMLTNVAVVVMVAVLVTLMGWSAFLLVQGPLVILAGGAGIWLFYVQHQFEDAYWEDSASWSYAEAALQGSSYLRLPKVLQFFSGNIGLHHVHHLNARIPNYNLQRAHDENPVFHDVPTLTFWDGIKACRLKVYDEDSGRLLTWAEAKRRHATRRTRPDPAPAPA